MGESNSYFGSKNAIYQKLINLIPRHQVYVEAFAGHAAVGRHLLPCLSRVFHEPDPVAFTWLTKHLPDDSYIYNRDVLPLLGLYLAQRGAFVFLDPPYPIRDRRDPRPRYNCEMSDEQHQRMLALLVGRTHSSQVMVCGFPWGMYAQALDQAEGWHRHDFKVVLRGGRMGSECVWVNYDVATITLHDYRYFGANKKVRQDLGRVVSRTVSKLRRLDRHKRQAVLDAITREFAPSVLTALEMGRRARPSTAGVPAVSREQAESPSAAANKPTKEHA